MKPTFHFIPDPSRVAVACGLGLSLAAGAVRAEPVSGRVEVAEPERSVLQRRGYIRTQVTAPSAQPPMTAPSYAVFLRVKESLPLDPPSPARMALQGLGLSPSVAACAVDGQVVLENADLEPVTFVLDDRKLGVVQPGDSVVYECTAGAAGEKPHTVAVVEWPGVRGAIYVGEVGAATSVDEDGRFRVTVPRGTYELRVVGARGVLARRDVEVNGRSVDVGTVALKEDTGRP